MPTRTSIACTPGELQDKLPFYKCLNCASDKEVDVIFLWLLAYMSDYDLPEDNAELMADFACLACLSDSQIKRLKVSLLAYWLGIDQSFSAEEFLESVKCLVCADPKILRGAQLGLLCQLFQAVAN